jgi:hypothetical protein
LPIKGGLEEFRENYGIPAIYEPFRVEINGDPEILPAFEDGDIPLPEAPGSPADAVILERNGIHYINNRALNPDKDTEKTLNPKFLSLVESVIKRTDSEAP